MSVTFNAHLGAEVERVAEGVVVARLALLPLHKNEGGFTHGGVYSALLDTAMGSAVFSTLPAGGWCATTALSIQYLDSAREGTLVAEGRVLRRGRRVAFVSGELRDAAGRLLATAQGSWQLGTARPAQDRQDGGAFVVLRGSGERIRVGKILAVGRNYADHVREMGNAPNVPPVLFLKPPSALVADGGAVVIPSDAGQVHHEVELVIVVGKAGRKIPEAIALEHVLGYAVGVDLTLRDLQGAAKAKGEPWTVAKGFDTSAPVSAVAPRDEVGDGSGLEISLQVNGALRQHASTSSMLHGVPGLVAYASRWMSLERGDLIFCGTPAGVGPIAPGDRLEASIEKVGSLGVTVESEAEP